MKILLTALWLGLPTIAAAQSEPPANAQPVMQTRGAFFALSVANVDSSARWYAEKLGLSVVMKAPRTDETKSAATVLSGGGLTVELVQHDDAVALGKLLPQSRGSLFVHGIFKVGVTVDDLDATLALLRARGVPVAIGPFPKRPDQPANAIIRDNAGNYIQLFGK